MSAPAPSLRGYGRFVRLHRALILAMALLGGAVGVAMVTYWPAVYVAQAKVMTAAMPSGIEADPDRPRLVSIDSDAQLMISTTVLARAAEAAEFPGGLDALRDSVEVSAVPNSRVLIVGVTHPDRAAALRGSGEVVGEFLRVRAEAAAAADDLAAARIEARVGAVLDQLAEHRVADGGGATSIGVLSLDATETELLDRLRVLTEEKATAAATSTAGGAMVSPPAAPMRGSRPLAAATVVSGLLIGTMAGVALAGLRAARP